MREIGLSDVDGSHRNMVKSSEPDASRSGRPPSAASYLETHPWLHPRGHVLCTFCYRRRAVLQEADGTPKRTRTT